METSTESIVQFRDIAKTYDGKTNVLERLDLDIGRGEFVTLLGPSGSGKTTLLMILAGFEEPTAGEVRLNGSLLNRVPAFKRNMGVVFQNYALFPHMSVRKNVGYPLVQRKTPRKEIDARVDEALDMIHMGAFDGRLPTQLSGGQQQRVALARALVYRPDVILMDEPLGALDKNLREHMQIEIKHLHESLGMTVLYVTHDQSEALTMSDRIAVFNDGAILQIGPPQEIYERPKCSFVANFIGEICNFPGVVASLEGDVSGIKLTGGILVQGQNIVGAKIGENVNVAVRPERIAITTGQPANQVGMLAARILGVIYHGDHLSYELEVAGASNITAKVAIGSASALEVGHEVNVAWDTAHARVLDSL